MAGATKVKERSETEIVFTVEESPDGGFEARALGHAIFTQAETFDGLRTVVQGRRPLPL